MLQQLNATLELPSNAVCISHDPGRYLCNYIYYRTLTLLQQRFESVFGISHDEIQNKSSKVISLFVHVPLFTIIPMEQQLVIVEKIIQEVSHLEDGDSDDDHDDDDDDDV
jgi:pyrrolidone-carboxylate peptidase